MKERVNVFARYGLFWLTFFVVTRLLFLTFHFDKTSQLAFSDVILTVLHGFRLDLSITGYLLLIPGLMIVFSAFLKSAVLYRLLWAYTIIFITLLSFLIVFDLEMYSHWGFRLDATPLLYIGDDTPIAAGMGTIIKLLVLWFALIISFLFFFRSFVASKIKTLNPSDWKAAAVVLVLTGLLFLPIRGTLGIAPINSGMVYFHPTNIYANHAAINPIWNTGYALQKAGRLKYSDSFLGKEETAIYFNKLYNSSGITEKVINTQHPNIIIVILESYTFGFLEPLGGLPDVAPNLNKLTREGILFTNMYSSGDRTDKGVVSILSGYPSQPVSSIIKYPKKTQNLPFLNQEFKSVGYHTAFTYGGNIDFANFRSYLSNARFDQITHSGHFPSELNDSKWGVHDEHVFKRFLEECNQTDEPFFKVMLTLSSHEPFEVPMETVFEGEDDRSKFLNSAHYTDRVLGEFINKAKASDWWDNTLIIITADHGHQLPDNKGTINPDRFKIPMLWLGGALTKTDTTISHFVNQTDIANTLLGQFDMDTSKFTFSNNILRKDPQSFAIYVYNNGFGFIDHTRHIVYDNTGQRYLIKSGVKNEEDLLLSKAYMQTLYNDFNSR